MDTIDIKPVTKDGFILAAMQEGASLKDAMQLWKESGNAVRRGKGGRAAFYDYLRDGNSVTTEKELLAYIASPDCEFSENERKPSNYGHWLAIAELVEAVRS